METTGYLKKRVKEKVKNIFNFMLEATGIKQSGVEKDSLTIKEFEKLLTRRSFSKYLFPIVYDKKRKIYINQDGTIGIMFECLPVLFSSPQTVNALASLLRLSYPKGASMQFILFADPYVEHYLNYYVNSKKNAPSYLKEAYRNLVKFYRNMETHLGYPVRNFRLLFTLKFPADKKMTEKNIEELKTAVYEILRSAGLYPVDMSPENYLFLMRRLLNDIEFEEIQRKAELLHKWMETVRLNRQIIFADTEVEAKGSSIRFGKRRFRCLTFKTMPEKIDFFFGNMISGFYELTDGTAGDARQVPAPFFVCFNIFCDSLNTEIQAKANLIMQQQPFGTFVVALKEKIDEYMWAVQKINNGEKFLRCFFTFWVYSDDEEELRTAIHKYARILESLGGNVQEETVVTVPLFVYSLPLGGVCDKTNFLLLDRDFVMPTESVAASAPVQGDFIGTGEPILLFCGRKGQVIGLDLFSKRSSSYNFFIVAPTGKGKSFFVNYIVSNYYGAGAKIRIIDIGGSYKKLANMFNGVYLEFSPDREININPFQSIHDPEYDVPIVVQTLVAMATAITEKLPEEVSSETAYNMIYTAVREVLKWAESESIPYNQLTIDNIYEMLANFTKYFPDSSLVCGEDKGYCLENFDRIASHLAFNLFKFTSEGPYGKWFSGKSTFDISTDDFVVLELEHLKNFPDLFKVVTLLVLNAVTADLYLSDRTRPTLIILDEAWQFLQDSPAFEKVIEEGYRRARKYRGSFGVVTQDILDIENFGRVGKVIYANSAFKFFLEGVNVEMAKKRNVVNLEDFVISLIKSVRYNAPKYSEIFIMTDNFGSGVVRLVVDPYSYYVYTSDPAEVSEIESLVKNGMSYDEAIKEMIRKHRGGVL